MSITPGERVLGTTTPLFTALLAALGALFRTQNFALLADWVNRLADGGTAVLLYLIALRLWRGLTLAFLLGLFFRFLLSQRFLFQHRAGDLLLQLPRPLRAGTRLAPPGARGAGSGCAGADDPSRRAVARLRFGDVFPHLRPEKDSGRRCHSAATLLLAYLAAIYFYFGSVVPNSMSAKTFMYGAGQGLFKLEFPNWYEVMMFWSGFLAKNHSSHNNATNYLLLVPMVLVVGLGIGEIARRSRRMLLLPAFCLPFTFAYIKAGGFLFPWYLIPTVPYLVLLVFAGFVLTGEKLAGVLKREPARGAVAVCALMLVMQSLVFAAPRGTIPSPILRTMYPAHTERIYREALKKIPASEVHPSIMAPEIGFIGYYRPEARIIDPIGLTNPEIVAFYKKMHLRLPDYMQFVTREVVAEFRPDYIITLYAFKNPQLDEEPEFIGVTNESRCRWMPLLKIRRRFTFIAAVIEMDDG